MPGLDTGNTAFMLFCTSLVLLMTPGLAFFYGGLVGSKNVLAIMMQSFVSMGWATILWFAVGYSLTFSGDVGGVIGNLDQAFLRDISPDTPSPNATIPLLVFVIFQLMVAIITPALITGAFANRVTFKAYLIFLTLWLLLVYFPFAHMVWGGGMLQDWGVLDYSGGIVVHNTAGMGALAAVLYVGARRRDDHAPHNIPLFAVGAGLLWFGWFGFNAGSQFGVDQVTVVAFFNTFLASAFAAIAWLTLSWIFEEQPKFVGLLIGALAGLVTVTPAAGYVTTTSAVFFGLAGGIVCYFAVALKNRLRLDDTLDVWGVHGVGGFLGIVMLGLLASDSFNPISKDGLLNGGDVEFFLKQCVAVAFSSAWAFVVTWSMLWLIDRVTPVRADDADETHGLDEALHGERAYLEAA